MFTFLIICVNGEGESEGEVVSVLNQLKTIHEDAWGGGLTRLNLTSVLDGFE
jgi:hypothetical protein